MAGFDNAPDAFPGICHCPGKLGPLYSPQLSIAALRLDGETLLFNSLSRAVRANAHYRPFQWSLHTRNSRNAELAISMTTIADRVAALTYYSYWRQRSCLNSKLASVNVTLTRRGRPERVLHSTLGGAFGNSDRPVCRRDDSADLGP